MPSDSPNGAKPFPSREEQAERIETEQRAHTSLALGVLAIFIAVASAVGGNALENTTFRNSALVLFIPALLAACAFAVGGIVRGVGVLNRIKDRAGRPPGRGSAIGGIGLSAVSLVIALVLFVCCFSWFSGHAGASSAIEAMHHAKQLCAAADIYTTTHDGKLPPADTWPQVIKTPEVPMDRILAGGRPWAMNRLLGGVALTAVPKRGETVLFFECKPGSHPAGGPELVPAQPRREGRYVIGFVDGHAELVSPAELGRLVWNPQVSPTPPAPARGPVRPVPAPVVKPAPPPLPAGRLPRSQDKGPRRRAPPPRGDRAPDLPP